MFYAAESGGVKTYLSAKAAWLAQRTRIRHTVIAPRPIRTHGESIFIGVPGVRIPFANGFRLPLSARHACRILEQLQPDLIEVGDPYHFAWAALRARASMNVPAVAFYHSDLPQIMERRFGNAAGRAAARYASQLYRRFDLVLAPSLASMRRLKEWGVERVRHQPLGVDTVIYSPTRRDNGLRVRLGLPDKARLLVFAGRLTREKKLPLLIDAVRKLGEPYYLLLVGNGETPAICPRVLRLPFQHDAAELAAILSSCDMLVHSGDQETFGLVVLEAMACGIPVLGTEAGGVAELIDEDCGLLVKPGSADALAEGIRHLYERDLHALGANARRKATQCYDWNVIIPQLMSQYGRLLASRPRRELEHGLSYVAK